MKATGIVRRIDDLGRVFIPKEIRRTMHIREGDPLEIYTDAEGGVVFRKYSAVGEMSSFTREYAEAISRSGGIPVVICDTDSVIAAAGVSRKDYIDKPITRELIDLLSTRRSYTSAGPSGKNVTVTDGGSEVNYLAPIVSEGSVIGAVMSLKGEGRTGSPDVAERKLVDAGAYFMSSQTEI